MQENVEVRKISETEYFVDKNRVSLIKGNIIQVIAIKEQTAEMALKYHEVCLALSNSVEGKINYLIDLNNCGKNAPGARATWNKISEEEKTDSVAIFGLHPVAKVIASFVMGVSKSKNQYFFSTKEEALKWLSNK